MSPKFIINMGITAQKFSIGLPGLGNFSDLEMTTTITRPAALQKALAVIKPFAKTAMKMSTSSDSVMSVFTAPGTYYSLAWETMKAKWSNDDIYIRKRYSTRGLEILVDVCGAGQEDLVIKIDKNMLLIKGESTDFLSKTIKFYKRIPIVTAPDILAIDPKRVVAKTQKGQVSVLFPLTKDDCIYDECYNVEWIKP
ncbi:hypothetical protein Tco_0693075 [Tanacetum coccineum]